MKKNMITRTLYIKLLYIYTYAHTFFKPLLLNLVQVKQHLSNTHMIKYVF